MTEERASGPGERLRAAREAMEVSAREVADALNLPIRVIEALEADDYQRLPPTVFTRGYLRSYARLLELPSDELLALYPEVAVETDTGTIEVTPAPGSAQRQTRLAMGVGGAVIVIVAVLAWVFGGDAGDTGDGAPAVEEPSELLAREPADAAQVGAEPGGETPAVTPDDPDLAEVEPDAPGEVVAQLQDGAPVAEAELLAEPPSAPLQEPTVMAPTDPGARRITPFGDDLIRFTFSDECWVEVKTVEGENLYSDLNRAGRTLTLQGRGPFRVLVGYAPGVALEFNGQPVALSRYTRNNVATLVLGTSEVP